MKCKACNRAKWQQKDTARTRFIHALKVRFADVHILMDNAGLQRFVHAVLENYECLFGRSAQNAKYQMASKQVRDEGFSPPAWRRVD